eukprot:8045097-Lingulodinium_polyedra.AAC.1
MQQPPERRPSASGAPVLRRGKIAQYLDVCLAASETPFGRLGVGVFWTPARRDLTKRFCARRCTSWWRQDGNRLPAFVVCGRSLRALPGD